ncbi:hypothetical protein Pmani_002166 [Petrolisthes manimaculis]|uniref:C-type lectin domain-containing protein n=1 Tax=Petrolisthes manimaculis TaxID=1843537 RepID=A0AAE1UR87_9EUCA|nr:hypothetical protein Pmani_002166 [Petrolisthes manimaculis]
MISSLKVALLILGLLCPCSADITPRGPPCNVNSREANELEENLAVNQLAILHLLNKDPSDTMYERMSTMESKVQENLRHLNEVVEECTTLREDHMKVQEDLRLLREVVEEFSTLREDLIALKNFVYVGKFFHHDGKKFYMNRNEKLSWTASRRWCQVRGGDLAQPTGDLTAFLQQVHQLFLPYVGSAAHEGVWLGASDIASEGHFLWVSGTQLPNNFPWRGGQPDNAGGHEDCLEYIYWTHGRTFSYNDFVCRNPRYFVCEL